MTQTDRTIVGDNHLDSLDRLQSHAIPHRGACSRYVLRFAIMLTAIGMARSALGAERTWKAGIARTVITPDKPLWMAGYGARDRPAEGKVHDLWIKVLALEDANGRRLILLTSDLLGFPQTIYENTCQALRQQFRLPRDCLMMTSSHTHCGPVLRSALYDIYPLDDVQWQHINEYSRRLEESIAATVGKAIGELRPARMQHGMGIARFAVNRRNNPEKEVTVLRDQGSLRGPIDHSVPVLAVRAPDGALRCVVFGYACHNTTLDFYRWCGDYAGFAQTTIEDRHPDATAMFYMGCGADQNPLPRRTLALCENYGRQLADAVEDVLHTNMPSLEPVAETRIELVPLALGATPSRAELQLEADKGAAATRRWAKRLLAMMDDGELPRREYPYPVQVWRLGGEQWWISLGGEVVVDYALRIKHELGPAAWVTGYANDVMAYIPSLRVLTEGGYEGATSMIVYGMPARRWANDVEERIVSAVLRLVESIRAGTIAAVNENCEGERHAHSGRAEHPCRGRNKRGWRLWRR